MTKARTLADNFAADINAVTADAPLTGGGTSGTVTVGIQAGTTAQSGAVQLTDSTASTSITTAATPNSVKSAYDLANGAIAKSTIDAKGDLLVGTANDTVSRLAVASTAGFVLTVDSAEATGLKWAAPAGGGKVLQVVQATYGTETTIATTTWTDSGLSATITPSATSSRILVMVATPFGTFAGGSTGEIGAGWRLLRGSTFIFGDKTASGAYEYGYYLYATSASNFSFVGMLGASYVDSPSTTSATTYKIQGSALAGKSCRFFHGGNTGSLILMEIGA